MTPNVTQGMGFCGTCGNERVEGARFCASCGHSFDAPASTPRPQAKQRKSNPVTLVLLTVIVLAGCLYLLNNTMAGVSLRCHLFGDYGACLTEAVADPGPVQEILDDIGRSV